MPAVISVVIPVYNKEPYLRGCVDSVLSSTYQDFEIILVDDGSTDGSLRLCTEYAGRDSRVKVLSQKNRGASSARNRGLEICRGDWVVFVEADDAVSPDFLARMAGEDQSVDMLLFDFAGNARELTAPRRKPVRTEADPVLLISRTLLPQPRRQQADLKTRGSVNLLSACAKGYKRSLIERHGLRFDEDVILGEDRLFNIEYLLRAERCVYISAPVYFYEILRGSLSHRFHAGLVHDQLALLEKLERLLQEVFERGEIGASYAGCVFNHVIFLLTRVIFCAGNGLSAGERRELCDILRESRAYRQAAGHPYSTGTLRQKIQLRLFHRRWYRLTELLCGLVNVVSRTRYTRRDRGTAGKTKE